MKKVICFTESLAGGGAEHQMSILANLLVRKGFDVAVVTYADIQDHYDLDQGIRRVRLAEGKSGIIKLLSIFSFFFTTDANAVISYRCPCNVRVMVPAMFRRKITFIVGERNTNMKGSPKKNEKWAIDRNLYKFADYIVSNSFTQARYISQRKPDWRTKIRVITNYTDLNQFLPAELPKYSDTLKIVIFARLSRQKNAAGLIEMLALLKRRTKKKVIIHWYCTLKDKEGEWTEEYKKFSNLAKIKGVDDMLEFVPAIKNPALVMSDYHVVCLPSLYEGFSNSIAEGICSGKPMLVSDVSDNGVMVKDGLNGYLFNPNDTESMCEAFLKMCESSESDFASMSKKSREIAESLFDEEGFINEYIKLL